MVMLPPAEPYLGLDILKLAVAPPLLPITAAVLSSTCWAVCDKAVRLIMLIIAVIAKVKIFFILIVPFFYYILKFKIIAVKAAGII